MVSAEPLTTLSAPTPLPVAMVESALAVLFSTVLPVPSKASPKVLPVTTPLSVSCVPVTFRALLAPSVTAPDKLLVPVEVAMVPPFRVMASALIATLRKSSVAPLATVVPAEVAPKPAALVMAKVPALTVVAPV